jgi:hypothetical protein
MPRASRPPSNFTSDRHVLYAGWVMGEMLRTGLPFEPVVDADGNYTNRFVINPPAGSDTPKITLVIPPPPDDWNLFNGDTSGPTFRGTQPE